MLYEVITVESLQMDWKPSLPVDLESQKTIQSHKEKIEIANEKAIHCIQNAKPVLIGMGKALDVLPNMKKNMFLHAGPPITWERMCGPMKGAMMGAMIYEGYAQDAKEAEQKLASGVITSYSIHYTKLYECFKFILFFLRFNRGDFTH